MKSDKLAYWVSMALIVLAVVIVVFQMIGMMGCSGPQFPATVAIIDSALSVVDCQQIAVDWFAGVEGLTDADEILRVSAEHQLRWADAGCTEALREMAQAAGELGQ